MPPVRWLAMIIAINLRVDWGVRTILEDYLYQKYECRMDLYLGVKEQEVAQDCNWSWRF